MGKYLHHYKSLPDLEKDYNDFDGIKSFVCSAGTFIYDRYEENDRIYFWKNGDKELITENRTPKVGAYKYEDGTGAYDIDNNTGVEITAIGEIQPGKYQEPWVSYTENVEINGMKAQLEGEENQTDFKLVGEVNFEFVK